ncbi:hypothetical protein TNCV_4629761 [Trichonephila clavipes]|nr:hypothetical protein TNCV_4629761 [Trichonephila clavipes]
MLEPVDLRDVITRRPGSGRLRQNSHREDRHINLYASMPDRIASCIRAKGVQQERIRLMIPGVLRKLIVRDVYDQRFARGIIQEEIGGLMAGGLTVAF